MNKILLFCFWDIKLDALIKSEFLTLKSVMHMEFYNQSVLQYALVIE